MAITLTALRTGAEVWPESNFLNCRLQNLVDMKKERNRAKREGIEGVGFGTLFHGPDPESPENTIYVMGNPSLSDVRVMMVGIRNRSNSIKDGIVWINELKVTDFESEGGWAATGNAQLSMSDIATLNFGYHHESAGFGSVDQGLNERRMDDFSRYTFAVQTDLGRFMPEKLKLRAPIFYSMTRETTTPKYNPLDPDVKLKDALKGLSRHEADSIKAFAVEKSTQQNFSISGLKFDRRSATPKPSGPRQLHRQFFLQQIIQVRSGYGIREPERLSRKPPVQLHSLYQRPETIRFHKKQIAESPVLPRLGLQLAP